MSSISILSFSNFFIKRVPFVFEWAMLFSIIQYYILLMFQNDFETEYDVVKKIGEGWFSRVYLTEHRKTRQEVALKAVAIDQRKCNSYDTGGSEDSDDEEEYQQQFNNQVKKEFLREYKNSSLLSSHANILTVYDIVFQVRI